MIKSSEVKDSSYWDRLGGHFCKLIVEGRGDSARGRNLNVLHFLDFVWSHPELPLHRYRPSRNPAAFLAMVFDLLGDALFRHGEGTLGYGRGQWPEPLHRKVKDALGAPWQSFIDQLAGAGLPHLAAVLDETMRAALRTPSRSAFPAYLRRLKLYMTPAQLALLDIGAVIGALPVGEVFAHLDFKDFKGLPARALGEEQHPLGGDLRRAIRKTFDAPWRRVLEKQGRCDLVTLFAAFPVDGLKLLAGADVSDYDFAVLYARATDSRAPGRVWQAPRCFVNEEDQQHFLFLTGRVPGDRLSRKTMGLSRLGLSGTFPKTIGYLDAALERGEGFAGLYARRSWRVAVEGAKDRIAQARALFIDALAHELARSDEHDEQL